MNGNVVTANAPSIETIDEQYFLRMKYEGKIIDVVTMELIASIV
jgi:hypothetical protein